MPQALAHASRYTGRMNSALDILQHHFGYDQFRAPQEDIINTVIAGNDALVIMPTGGGKSLCYQIPGLARPGVAIVISPLIALMQNQVDALAQLGISAAFLNSSINQQEAMAVEQGLREGHIDLLYVAPERFNTASFASLLGQLNLGLFAVDEAHCVSQWGHDFRADYLHLAELMNQFAAVPRIALTATADENTRAEIVARLQLRQQHEYVCGFDRSNIQYRIEQKQDGKRQLLQFLEKEYPKSAGVVYCLSRKKVEDTAQFLQQQGFSALPYHAGLSQGMRQEHQDRFLREENIIIVATIAFGMGIDKPDVRFVAHLDLPKSVEAYYQETGRAGRDGTEATAWMIYGLQDVIKLRQMAEGSNGSEQFKMQERHRLDAMLGLCELTTCRRQTLLAYFGEELAEPCGNCDNCITPPETWDASEAAQKALSAVYRSGQRFGVNHLIDILLAKETEKVFQFNHHQLSTFGIGKELNATQWRNVFRQLVAQGLLNVDVTAFGGLRLSESCREVLQGKKALFLRKEALRSKSSKAKSNRAGKSFLKESEQAIWEALRSLRKDLALEQDLPPYMIFHDATLMEMIRLAPKTLGDLSQISGVGDSKLDLYGQAFLDCLLEYADEGEAESSQEHTVYQTYTLFKAGMEITAIAAQRDLNENTIYQHIEQLIADGALAVSDVLELQAEDIQAIEEALDDAEAQSQAKGEPFRLKPVFEALDECYSYTDIRCIKASRLAPVSGVE